METMQHPAVDWLSLSPRVMARVMEVSNENGITPAEAFSRMVKFVAKRKVNLEFTRLSAVEVNGNKKEVV